jgi:hypothetical protein
VLIFHNVLQCLLCLPSAWRATARFDDELLARVSPGFTRTGCCSQHICRLKRANALFQGWSGHIGAPASLWRRFVLCQ